MLASWSRRACKASRPQFPRGLRRGFPGPPAPAGTTRWPGPDHLRGRTLWLCRRPHQHPAARSSSAPHAAETSRTAAQRPAGDVGVSIPSILTLARNILFQIEIRRVPAFELVNCWTTTPVPEISVHFPGASQPTRPRFTRNPARRPTRRTTRSASSETGSW